MRLGLTVLVLGMLGTEDKEDTTVDGAAGDGNNGTGGILVGRVDEDVDGKESKEA